MSILGRWIVVGAGPWPPRSPDLILFFLLTGFRKTGDGTLKFNEKMHLERRMRDAVEIATPDVSLSCGKKKNIQMDVCKLMNGAHTEAV
jgi:hypothetical protein